MSETERSVPQHVLEWHQAIREALPNPYEMDLIDGVIPIVTIPPTFDGMYDFLKKILPSLPGVRGGRMYAEGVVLEPRLPAEPERDSFPHNEPGVMEKYGLGDAP